MDWYYGCENSEFVLPKDQEDLLERYSSPGRWSEWGIKAPECFNSTQEEYLSKNTDATEVEFNFIDKSFEDEIEFDPYLQDKDQSSSSSVCGGLSEQFQQTGLSCDHQSKYELQDLSTFEHVDDIFLDSVLEDFPCVENLHKSFLYPENQSSNTNGVVQKDVAASGFVPCNSDSKDCQDIEARAIKILDPFEQSNGDKIMPEQLSLEEFTLQGFEMLIAQLTEKTRICFRDALFRLAKNTKHVVEDLDGDLNMHQEMPHSVCNETMRSVDKKPMESETNIVDRAVANLMFNKMEINILDIPFTTLVNMKREVTGSRVLQEQSSKALDVTQKSHSPHPEKLPAHA
ncbi:protein LNK3-like isoform X2 [Vigna unguiculata]|uniref:protein LNK3-like isoform X2 n=1 Tax=Vigna unguiculata TaxID=3917 RepID=UPI0010167E18|nr:protein LNK3-like isoform X2 [Vigna unguiculata]